MLARWQRNEIARVQSELQEQRTLGDVLAWLRGQTPRSVAGILTQDEYTHDVVSTQSRCLSTTWIMAKPMLHDPTVRKAIEARLNTIRADSLRQWGDMSVDQMLWHVNQFLSASIGEGTLETQKSPIPAPIMKFLVLYMPWPKSAPTNKSAVAKGQYDLEAERARCKELIATFVSRPVDGEWPVDPSFGRVSGKFASRLQAKHLDHHLRQFNA